MGRNQQNAKAQQWEGYETGLIQIPNAHNERLLMIEMSEEPKPAAEVATEADPLADAPKGDAPAPDAPKM